MLDDAVMLATDDHDERRMGNEQYSVDAVLIFGCL
jgi:hypothetical protein